MRINVTGRHMELADDFKAFVHDKAGKLQRYYDILEIEVVVAHDKTMHEVEMIVRAGNKNRFVAKERHPEPHAAVDLVIEHLKHQITRHKERQRNRMHEGRGQTHGGPSVMQAEIEAAAQREKEQGESGRGPA